MAVSRGIASAAKRADCGTRHSQARRGRIGGLAAKSTRRHKNGGAEFLTDRSGLLPGSGVRRFSGAVSGLPRDLTVRNDEHGFVSNVLYRGMLDL